MVDLFLCHFGAFCLKGILEGLRDRCNALGDNLI